MNTPQAAHGILHTLPSDMEQLLIAEADILERWNKLTPIQRNEWICWVTIVKKEETRQNHLTRMMQDLADGKRKPCCWPGCPHRNPNNKKWFKEG